MKRYTLKLKANEKGQSLVEMALVSMLFFFLLFGILEFGRALWTYNTIVQSTRTAARWAVVNVANNTDTTDIDRSKNLVVYGYPDVSSGPPIVPGLSTTMVTVTVQPIDTDVNGVAVNQKISVSVTGYQFQFIVPLAPSITIPAFETALYTESMGNVPS
jgi:Flp pilus assembly protein TadG